MESNFTSSYNEENQPLIHTRAKQPSIEIIQDRNTPQKLTLRRIMIFVLTSFVYFLTWCCVSMWAPFFPGEAAKRGVDSTAVGFIFGVYCLVSFLSSLIYGPIVIPNIGPYFVLFAGLFLCGGAFVICGFVDIIQDATTFTILCLLIRAIGALGGSACETTIVVVLTQEFPESIAFAIGILEVFAGLGFIIGPVLGGLLYSLGGFKLPMLVVGGSLLVFLPIIWLLLPRKEYQKKKNQQSDFQLFKSSISTPGVILMCFSCSICMISLTFLEPTLQPHVKSFGIGSVGVALLFLSCSGAFTLSSPIAGCILSKKSCGRAFILIGSFGAALSVLFMGPSPFLKPLLFDRALWLLVFSLVCCGFFIGLFVVPVLPEMLQCCREKGLEKSLQLDSLLSGYYTGFVNLGAFIGPVLGGIMSDKCGFSWTTTVISFLLFIQFLVTSLFFICNRRKTPEPNYSKSENECQLIKSSSFSERAENGFLSQEDNSSKYNATKV